MAGWLDSLKGQSFAGSYWDAARRRAALEEAYAANDNDSWYGREDQYNAQDSALRAQQGQAVAGGIVTGLTGATTLLSNAMKDAQIQDTSMQEGMISDLYNAGHLNYNNYDQLANDYAQVNFNPQFNYQDIRGMSEGQQIGSVATSTLSGAAIGTQIMPGWGTAIGAGVGLLTGLGGVLSGNDMAKTKLRSLQLQSDIARSTAQQNFAAAHERIGDNIHRQNAVNAVKYGGAISRFADNALLKVPKQVEHKCGGKIERLYCNGGVKVRIHK